MTPLAELLTDLAAAPRLPGASCRDHAQLYDRTAGNSQATDTREARTAALALCHACPDEQACRAWIDTLPPDQRPIGVVAGQIVAEDNTSSFQRERAERDAHIVKLHATGMTSHEIASLTGHSKSTVLRAVRRNALMPANPANKASA